MIKTLKVRKNKKGIKMNAVEMELDQVVNDTWNEDPTSRISSFLATHEADEYDDELIGLAA